MPLDMSMCEDNKHSVHCLYGILYFSPINFWKAVDLVSLLKPSVKKYSTCSTSYVGMGQVQNGPLYLRYRSSSVITTTK